MNRADRRLAMKRPGGFERLLNEAWENGFQAGKTKPSAPPWPFPCMP